MKLGNNTMGVQGGKQRVALAALAPPSPGQEYFVLRYDDVCYCVFILIMKNRIIQNIQNCHYYLKRPVS
jgi:hypothetical protein